MQINEQAVDIANGHELASLRRLHGLYSGLPVPNAPFFALKDEVDKVLDFRDPLLGKSGNLLKKGRSRVHRFFPIGSGSPADAIIQLQSLWGVSACFARSVGMAERQLRQIQSVAPSLMNR